VTLWLLAIIIRLLSGLSALHSILCRMEINAASALITHVPDFIYDVGIGEWFDIHVTR